MARKHKLCLCAMLLIIGLSTIHDAKTVLASKDIDTYNKLKDKIEIYEVTVESVTEDNTITFTIDDIRHSIKASVDNIKVSDNYVVYTINGVSYYNTIDELVEEYAGKGFHKFMLGIGYAFCVASVLYCFSALSKKR